MEIIAYLEGKSIEILGLQNEDYGRFAWIIDPYGVKVELWQQLAPAPVRANSLPSRRCTSRATRWCSTISGMWAARRRWPRRCESARHRQPSGRRRQRLARRREGADRLRLANATRIVEAVELPLTVDFEGAYSIDPGPGGQCRPARRDRRGRLQFRGPGDRRGGASSAAGAGGRIEAIRAALGDAFFINARTDMFLKAHEHDRRWPTRRSSGRCLRRSRRERLLCSRLADPKLVERVGKAAPLPVNAIAFPGAPTRRLGQRRRRRISHGPFPHGALMATLEQWRGRRSPKRMAAK